jgi:transposase
MAQDWRTPDGGKIMPLKGVPDARIEDPRFPRPGSDTPVHPAAPCGEDATVAELREEVTRLRRQLKRAELEREILKKATAYFAKESL